MEQRKLSNSTIKVSALCLGTMTWGEQNSEQDAFEQLDYSFENGINFIDTAELYPVPPKAESYTKTETMIGNWMKARNNRDKVVLATKVAGRAPWVSYIRNGENCFNEKNIREAIEGSLKRLQTDVIDLYQLHWPDRKTNFFGQLGFKPPKQDNPVAIEETLSVLETLIKEGKIKHIGLSNETPWGVMRYINLADVNSQSRVVSVQNPYSLLNRTYEVGNAEIAHQENVGLLAYSPLAFGVLSNKYAAGLKPEGARLTLFGSHFGRYSNPLALKASEKYAIIAEKHGMTPAQMALAFVTSRPFVTSNIIGATTIEQLKENIASAEIVLSKEILKEIEAVHKEIPNPCP